MAVTAILHGGLGNQLFQFFYATLLADALHADRLSLVTARLRHYAVGRDMELAPLLDGNDLVTVRNSMTIVERWRVPKVLQRLTGREIAPRWGARHALVDGYFQTLSAYGRFDRAASATVLDRWRRSLHDKGLLADPALPHLTHVRLTDFVAGGRDPRELAAPIVAAIPADGAVMTDDEPLIRMLLAARPTTDRPTVVPTTGLSSWEVLHAMSRFRAIHTNGSSLACWAAALAGARLVSTNADHTAFSRFCAVPADGHPRP